MASIFEYIPLLPSTIDPKVTYTYYNPDGTLLLTHTFEPTS